MTRTSLLPTLGSALAAGLIAALVVAAFHLLLTEPVVDQAIALEEQLAGEQGPQEEALIGREVQRPGLVIGFLLYGLSWALLYAVVYYFAEPWLPGFSPAGRGLVLAGIGYWSIALFPFLKYPANPPGVGDPESIAYRQGLYLAALGVALASAVGAVLLGQHVHSRTDSPWLGGLAALALLAPVSALAYLALPANPDAVRMPADLVGSFRALSLAGLTLFWSALGLGFAFLAQRAARPQRPLPTAP